MDRPAVEGHTLELVLLRLFGGMETLNTSTEKILKMILKL